MAPDPRTEREAARITHTRGASLKLYRANLQVLVDARNWELILRDCPPGMADFLSREADPDEWIPAEWLEECLKAFQRRSERSPWQTRGGMMARHLHELGKDLGWFLGTAPETAIADYPKLWAHLHRGGLAEVAALAPGRAELHLFADFPYAEYPAEYLPRFFTSLLQLRGAGAVRVRYEAPEPEGWRHRYVMSWEDVPAEDGDGR